MIAPIKFVEKIRSFLSLETSIVLVKGHFNVPLKLCFCQGQHGRSHSSGCYRNDGRSLCSSKRGRSRWRKCDKKEENERKSLVFNDVVGGVREVYNGVRRYYPSHSSFHSFSHPMSAPTKDVIQSPLSTNGLSKFVSFALHRFIERAVWTFAELDIATLMAEHQTPLTATELSQLKGNNWNAELLYRLLRTTADADIVKELHSADESESRFQLTESGLFLVRDHPSQARDFVRLEFGHITHQPSTHIPHLIKHGYRDGNGCHLAFGAPLFGYLHKDENKEDLSVFNNAMTTYSTYFAPDIGSVVDFSRFKTLVDVGSGAGALLASILQVSKQLHGIALDLPPVVEQARNEQPNEFEKKKIESHRYEYVSGDMFNGETIPSADAYIMKNIIHDWNDDDATKILTAIYLASQKHRGAKTVSLFLVEMVIIPESVHNWEARMLDMEMLTLLNAKERTLPEYIKLLKQSGFEFKQLHRMDSSYSVVEAVTTVEEPAQTNHQPR